MERMKKRINSSLLPAFSKAGFKCEISTDYKILIVEKIPDIYKINLEKYPFQLIFIMDDGLKVTIPGKIDIRNDDNIVKHINELYKNAAKKEKECPICYNDIEGSEILMPCDRHYICRECNSKGTFTKPSRNLSFFEKCPICRGVEEPISDGRKRSKKRKKSKKKTKSKKSL